MAEKQPGKKKKKKGSDLRAPRGFRDIIGEDFLALQGLLEKASEIALYYGFTPIMLPMVEYEHIFQKGTGETSDIVEKEMYSVKSKGRDKLTLRPEPTPPMMRAYIEHGMQSQPQPVMLFTYGSMFRHDKPQNGRYREFTQFGIEVLGSDKPMADVLTIQIFVTIAREAGLDGVSVILNSIGDNDCRPNYRKELVNYYKKHTGDICKDCHRRLKTNPLRLLDCKEEGCQAIKENAPASVTYLCEPCRKHFQSVLEHLEALGIPYTIDKNLVRGLDYYTRTVYEVVPKTSEKLADEGEEEGIEKEQEPVLSLGGGGRYDYLAKTLGHNKQIPGVGFGMGIDRVLMQADKSKLTPRILHKAKVFFIQLGADAKQKSLQVIEVLREAKIPIKHSVSRDSLSTQLGMAERSGVSTVVILGTKEALENKVIVRNMATRSQDTIPILELAQFLKKK